MDIYVDGSQGVNGELYIGIVGVENEKCLFHYTSFVPIPGDNMTAEQLALLTALELIKERYQKENITIYSDQVFYVETLNSGKFQTKYFRTHEYITYLYDMYQGLKKYVKIEYIKRNKNKADKIIRKYKKKETEKETEDTTINLSLVRVLEKTVSYRYREIEDKPQPKRFKLKAGRLVLG